MYAVNAVGRMCIGNDMCAYVDAEGCVVGIPFHNIEKVIVGDSELLTVKQ
jgi:hypothetical protein